MHLSQVIIRNAQGSDERDINVNIMGKELFRMTIIHYSFPPDKPTPPLTCKVTEVFHDNVLVNWSPPADDGGTEITRCFLVLVFVDIIAPRSQGVFFVVDIIVKS